MKPIVALVNERPPHEVLQDLDAFNVDRLLTRTGRGRFAFHINAYSTGADLLLEGRLVVIGYYASITAGGRVAPYVGIVTQLARDNKQNVIEVSGDNYASALYNAAMPATSLTASHDAGWLARQALTLGQGMGRSLFIERGVMIGTPLQSGERIDFGAQTLGQALDNLAKRVDDEWWIEHLLERNRLRHFLYWRHRRGVDASAYVYLEEGRDFTVAEYKRDALGQVRSAVVVGGGGPLSGRPSAAVSMRTDTMQTTAQHVAAPNAAGAISSPLIDRDIIEHRPLDTDDSVLMDGARRAYNSPTTARESIAVTATSEQWSLLNPGDYVTARFFSLGVGGLVRRVRINAMQPDEARGECDMDVLV